MRKLILALLLCSSMAATAQKSNFSGGWLIDKTRTEFGKAPESVIPRSMKVDQQADKLMLSRINLNEQLAEQPATTETISFDGSPFVRNAATGKVTTTLSWLDDQSFKLTRKGSMTATENWTLEGSGKTLVINRSVEQADGFKYEIKCYYNRQ